MEHSQDDQHKNQNQADSHSPDTSPTEGPISEPLAEDNDKTVVQDFSANTTNNSVVDQPKLGDLLCDRYRLIDLIGTGGMSYVYKAIDTFAAKAGDNEPYVAVKILSSEFSAHPDAVAIMQREAKKTRLLAHPNIVQIHDFVLEDSLCYIVMEYLQGETLDQIIKRSKPNGLPKNGVFNILKQITSALEFAHQQGILHSDLKPSNIFITQQQRVKIFDFGVSRGLKQKVDEYAVQLHSDEPEYEVGGYTPAYASLNMLNQQTHDVKDDIYGLACITYEMFTSKHPYARKPANKAFAEKIKPTKVAKLAFLNWKGLEKGLQLEHHQRTESVQQFYHDLTRTLFKPVALAASALLVSVVAITLWQNSSQTISETQEQLAHYQQQDAQYRQLLVLAETDLEATLESINQLPDVHRTSLLNILNDDIVQHFSAKSEQYLRPTDTGYADYPNALQTISEAEKFLKDSQQLTSFKQQVLDAQNQLVSTLEQKFNQLLEQQDYKKRDTGDDVYSLQQTLLAIAPEHTPKISEQSQSLFLTGIQQALAEHNVAELNRYQQVGDVIFVENQEYQQLKEQSEAFLLAAKQIDRYNKQVVEQPDTPFPTKAATIFYQQPINKLIAKIEAASNTRELEQVDEEVFALVTTLPSDFALSKELQNTLANAYFKRADELNASRSYRAAAKALSRGRQILNDMNKPEEVAEQS
ncbi:MAG: serine/threonine protein kinase [Kangiella sp.]|nr:serine/threonine protein kinase [Kangiella sp.]